jgi:hypothetical protein
MKISILKDLVKLAGSVKESLDKVTGSWWGVRVKE